MTTVAEFVAKLGLIPDEASWEKGDKLIDGLKHSLEAFIGVEALNGIKEMVMGVVELGGQLNDTAQKTGVSVEALQFLGFVAKQNSSSMEEVTGASRHYSHSLIEATQKGTGPAADAFQKLGINIHTASFKANSMDEQFQLIADKLAKLPDGTKKTALAMDLFGRSGQSLIPTLNDLGRNGDELHKTFEDLGGALSTDQATQLDAFGDDVDKAKYSLTALKNQIVVQMLPTLQKMITGFIEWVKANKEVIASGIQAAIEILIGAFRILGEVIKVIADVMRYFSQHTDQARAILIALGIVIGVFAAEAAISWAIAFAPVIAVVATIAGLILLVEHFGEVVDAVFGSALPTIEDAQKMLDLKNQGYTDEEAANQVMADRTNATGKYTSADADIATPEDIAAAKSAIAKQPPLNGVQNQAVSFGDTHITVHGAPGMNEQQLAAKMKEAAHDVHKDAIRQAYDSLSGGLK